MALKKLSVKPSYLVSINIPYPDLVYASSILIEAYWSQGFSPLLSLSQYNTTGNIPTLTNYDTHYTKKFV